MTQPYQWWRRHDEYWGRFFKGGHDRIPLKLIDATPLASGLVILALRAPRRVTRHSPVAAVPCLVASDRWEIAPGLDDEVPADTLLPATS